MTGKPLLTFSCYRNPAPGYEHLIDKNDSLEHIVFESDYDEQDDFSDANSDENCPDEPKQRYDGHSDDLDDLQLDLGEDDDEDEDLSIVLV